MRAPNEADARQTKGSTSLLKIFINMWDSLLQMLVMASHLVGFKRRSEKFMMTKWILHVHRKYISKY